MSYMMTQILIHTARTIQYLVEYRNPQLSGYTNLCIKIFPHPQTLKLFVTTQGYTLKGTRGIRPLGGLIQVLKHLSLHTYET